MLKHRRASAPAHRNVKRQVPDPSPSASGTSTGSTIQGIVPPILSPSPSNTASLPIPIPSLSTTLDTTVTILSSSSVSSLVPSTVVTQLPPPTNATVVTSSSTSSPPVTSPPVVTSLSSSSVASSPSGSSLLPPNPASASDVTSLTTTTSDAVPTTVTSVTTPSPSSLATAPKSSPSFLQNKAASGAVFAVVALVILAGLGSLGFRFYKTVKEKKADRETEDAARDAARVRMGLDDDDDDMYGGSSNAPGLTGMVQYDGPPVLPTGFDLQDSGGLGLSESEERRSAESMNPYGDNEPGHTALYRQPTQYGGSPYLTSDAFDAVERGHPTRSGNSSRDMLLADSDASTETLSKQRSVSSHPAQLPSLPLPEAFGEGEPSLLTPPVAQPLGDDEDYQGTIGRVLKIANE
ncbi:hypothetical protein JB92DRAFT_3130758 [Gautieria morchelliformis]|nr:hypothetical protein JB92DRAFT_3130758 [Gautieria morchelliformis]